MAPRGNDPGSTPVRIRSVLRANDDAPIWVRLHIRWKFEHARADCSQADDGDLAGDGPFVIHTSLPRSDRHDALAAQLERLARELLPVLQR